MSSNISQVISSGVASSLIYGLLLTNRSKNSFTTGGIYGTISAVATMILRSLTNPYFNRLKMPEAKGLAFLSISATSWVITALMMKYLHKKTQNELLNLNTEAATASALGSISLLTWNSWETLAGPGAGSFYDIKYEMDPNSDPWNHAMLPLRMALMMGTANAAYTSFSSLIRGRVHPDEEQRQEQIIKAQLQAGIIYGTLSGVANTAFRIAVKSYFKGLPPAESKNTAFFLMTTTPWLLSTVVMRFLHKMTQQTRFQLNPITATGVNLLFSLSQNLDIIDPELAKFVKRDIL